MTGKIFSIEEFSVFDGPGIRTTVFFKGCPLRCSWCHNPEGQESNIQIVRSPNGCINCKRCEEFASRENDRLCFTEKSISCCPYNLLRFCGEEISGEKLCKKLLKNAVILNNGGGVTFSGGEPLMQSGFLLECLELLKGKVHTAIQTSGYCDERIFKSVMEMGDYYLYDLKIFDDSTHRKYTGVSNEIIKKNFRVLSSSEKEFVVRIPLIPNVTDTRENILGIAGILKENMVSYVELLPYNKLAGGKYKMLLREYSPGFDEYSEVNTQKEIFDEFNITIKIL